MKRAKYPVVYVSKKDLSRRGISLSTFPSAGPRCNVWGMRNKYWGFNSFLIRHGEYVYKVPWKVYELFA